MRLATGPTRSSEQVNEDKESFARELIEEAEADLGRRGLVLDTLKIKIVADEVGYLDSIGRKQTTQLIRRSRIAEAERQSEAQVQSAENQRKTGIAQVSAALEIAKAEADKRLVTANSSRPAQVARVRSEIEAQIARAQAELNVQTARIEQVKVQLEADVVAPARAYKSQAEANAKAEVASIRTAAAPSAPGIGPDPDRAPRSKADCRGRQVTKTPGGVGGFARVTRGVNLQRFETKAFSGVWAMLNGWTISHVVPRTCNRSIRGA